VKNKYSRNILKTYQQVVLEQKQQKVKNKYSRNILKTYQ